MIEKLRNPANPPELSQYLGPAGLQIMVNDKINELVEAVNKLEAISTTLNEITTLQNQINGEVSRRLN